MGIEIDRTDTAVPLTLKVEDVTGLTGTVTVLDADAATPSYYDFDDGQFKTVGWVDRDGTLAAVDAVLSPGLYHFPGGMNLGGSNFPAGSERLVVEYSVSGSVTGNTSEAFWVRPATAGASDPILPYFGKIWIDLTNGTAGTTVGTHGTAATPANTLANADTIAAATGIRHYFIRNGTITLGQAYEGWTFEGNGDAVLSVNGQDLDGSTVRDMRVAGTFGGTGQHTLQRCIVQNVSGASGLYHQCAVEGDVTLRAGATLRMVDSLNADVSQIIDANGGTIIDQSQVGFTRYLGLTNGASVHAISSRGGFVDMPAANTGGTAFINGLARFQNLSAVGVGFDGFINEESIDSTLSGTHGAGNWEGAAIIADDSAILESAAISFQTSTLVVTAGIAGDPNQHNGNLVRLTTSDNKSEIRRIVTHDSTNFTIDTAPINSMSGGTLAVIGRKAEVTAVVDPVPIAAQVWDEDLTAHVLANSAGLALSQAATGGVDLTELTALLTQFIGIVRKFGPIVVDRAIVTDTVHAGDVGVTVTIPVIKDGEFADLTGVTSVSFHFQPPASDTTIALVGATGPGASEVTVTTDATVFDVPGRWRVAAVVTSTVPAWVLSTDISEVNVLKALPIE